MILALEANITDAVEHALAIIAVEVDLELEKVFPEHVASDNETLVLLIGLYIALDRLEQTVGVERGDGGGRGSFVCRFLLWHCAGGRRVRLEHALVEFRNNLSVE